YMAVCALDGIAVVMRMAEANPTALVNFLNETIIAPSPFGLCVVHFARGWLDGLCRQLLSTILDDDLCRGDKQPRPGLEVPAVLRQSPPCVLPRNAKTSGSD